MLLGRDTLDARVYLGIIHHTDGLTGFRRRFEIAKQYLPDFGIASVCGYGRLSLEDTEAVFELHRNAARFLRADKKT